MNRLHVGLVVAAALVALCAVPAPADPEASPDPVNIGLVDSVFVDVPTPMVGVLMKPFSALMKQLTGLNGKATSGGDYCAIGEKLKDGKLHLGVFQGFEYAWALQKYPKLRPLMIAVYYNRHLRSSVLVHKDSPAQGFADLKGKDLALPMGTKGHGRLFLERNCGECGQCGSKGFFNEIVRPEHGEAALDSLCDGWVHAALVDNISLECYKQVRTGAFKRLRVLKESEVFPPAVITYYDGALDQDTLQRFSTGMLAATKTPRAKEMMELFKITSFEAIPDDYNDTLTSILRAYPPPEAAAPTSARTTPGN